MTDDLLDRLRAADPAADGPSAPLALTDRARVTTARRRRAGARAAGVAGGGSALAAIAVAAALVPAGGDGGLAVADVVARAAEATDLPAERIVLTRSEVDVTTHEGPQLHEAKTTWIRVGADGEPVTVRSVITEASGEGVRAGIDEVSRTKEGRQVIEQLDTQSNELRTIVGTQVPSVVSKAHGLLERARAGDGRVRLGEETTYAGRRALPLAVAGVDTPPTEGERRVLYLDAETYAPLALTVHSAGDDVDGKPYTYDLVERVIEHRVLPDTAENRARLELRAPVGG